MARLSTPVAILIGFILFGILVGGGLYFGLRERSASGPVPSPRKPVVASEPPPGALQSDAHSALAQQKAQLVDRCWMPSLKKAAAPPSVRYEIDFVFAPGGRELGRSMRAIGPERTDLTACLDKTLVPIDVRATPGNPHVVVELAFP
jgi:hypothetical protein